MCNNICGARIANCSPCPAGRAPTNRTSYIINAALAALKSGNAHNLQNIPTHTNTYALRNGLSLVEDSFR